MTLIEMILAISIVGILLGIALPAFDENQKKVERAEVMAEMLEISGAIDTYLYDNFGYPDSLADIRMDDRVDAWGNPYQYLRIDGAAAPGKGKGKGGLGKVRKDKNLVPINTDYDLYSMGPDGRSVSPLTAKHSRDDIVRANNGSYLGVAENY